MLEDNGEIHLQSWVRNILNLKIYTHPNYESNRK